MLAIRLHALGDTVLTLPYLHALRRLLPEATLDFLTRREVADIPESVVLFDRIFEIGGGRNPRRQLLSALMLMPRLWKRRYDVILDLQRSRISRLVRIVLGPPAWSEFDRLSPRPAGERTRATIEAVGLGSLDVYPDLDLRESDPASKKLRIAGWDGTSRLIVLNPAGTFSGRRWPLESYAQFAQRWLAWEDAPTQFLVLGLPSLEPKASYLEEHLGHRLLNLVGRTSPGEAFALLRRAALVLSDDSGLMHMAWVAGAPTLALFGASSTTWARPHGNYTECVRACTRPDGVCIRDGCCREGRPACLDRVSVEVVMQRARKLMRQAAHESKVISADGRFYAPLLDRERLEADRRR